MYAVGSGMLKITRKLLEHNANPYIKNNDGKNTFDIILLMLSRRSSEKEQFKIAMQKAIENEKINNVE